MTISIIVPAYNEEKMLPQSLRAIQQAGHAFTARGWQFEIVVCDNNSSDRTADVAREHGARVVFEPINQISRARNAGATAATGDWFIFVDADSFPTAELFRRVAEEIEKGKALGGGCLIRMDQNFFVAHLLVRFWNLISRLRRWAAGSFIYCEAKAFRELGGFSTGLFVTEELEFSDRLKSLAKKQERKVVIITDVRMTTSARKMHLYNKAEHGRFLLKAAFRSRRVFASREECHVWYDGRR